MVCAFLNAIASTSAVTIELGSHIWLPFKVDLARPQCKSHSLQPMNPSHEYRAVEVISEVQLVEGVKVVRLHSPIGLRNDTQLPIGYQ
jgi:hypothetical protein